jgi:hypothetical protein
VQAELQVITTTTTTTTAAAAAALLLLLLAVFLIVGVGVRGTSRGHGKQGLRREHACWMALRNAAGFCLFEEGRSAGTSDTPEGKALMRALRHAQSNLRQAIRRMGGSVTMKTEAEVRALFYSPYMIPGAFIL